MVKDITIDNNIRALLDGGIKSPGEKDESSKIDFKEVLKNTISEVNTLQKDAAIATDELLKGNGSIHDTMIALGKADISFRFMMKVRTKITEAYKQVMAMPV